MENKNYGKMQNRVAELRKKQGLSQQKLGEMLFLDQRTMSHIEHGHCTLTNLLSIADFFGVSLDYILMRPIKQENIIEDIIGELDCLDVKILLQVKRLTDTEKERLLKHLELENTLTTANGN